MKERIQSFSAVLIAIDESTTSQILHNCAYSLEVLMRPSHQSLDLVGSYDTITADDIVSSLVTVPEDVEVNWSFDVRLVTNGAL